MIQSKRVYEAVASNDGYRVLVDRLWPRGVSKSALQLAQWLKDVAPSNELRKQLHQAPESFAEFRLHYRQELAGHPEYWLALLDIVERETLTLLYAAKDVQHNNAVVLAEFLEDALDRRNSSSSPVCYAGEL